MNYKYMFLLNILYLCKATNPQESVEYLLVSELFKHYDVKIRPIYNNSETIFVTVGLALRKIQSINDIGQSMKSTVNLQIFWKDEFLTWNETNYHGISSIIIPYHEYIWIPDLMILNELYNPSKIGFKDAYIRIYSNGEVFMWTQTNIDTYCEIKSKKYPFDQQKCDITFTKFMSSDDIVKLRPRINGFDLSAYTEIAEWKLKDHCANSYLSQIDESTDTLFVLSNYTRINFSVLIQRTCKLCIFNIILPVLILAVLNLLSFFVPSESGEKTSLPLSLFLTLAVFLTIISQSLPECVDGVSCISSYVIFQLAASGITLMSAVISLKLYHGGHHSTSASKCIYILQKFGNRTAMQEKQRTMNEHEEEETNESDIDIVNKFKNASVGFDRLMFILVLICQCVFLTIFFTCVMV